MEDAIPEDMTNDAIAPSDEDTTMSVSTLEPKSPPSSMSADPFFYGWRTVTRWQQNGTPKRERVPLTEWDVLHPKEGDFIVNNQAHALICLYLMQVFEEVFAGRLDILVLHDHRVDWEVRGITPHGPDIAVIEGLREPWKPRTGTFKVKETKTQPLLVIEVTSPATRKGDLNEKVTEYFQAGVPFYLILDQEESEDREFLTLIAYRATPEGYVQIPEDPEKGVWIPTVRLWFKADGPWVTCHTIDGNRILSRAEIAAKVHSTEEAAQLERVRADAADQRAAEADRKVELLEQKLREAEERLKTQ
jgi:hypothetical protein